ncbi:MAG: hypothetical protein ABJB16_12170 [Saprospiraceae bacterium]
MRKLHAFYPFVFLLIGTLLMRCSNGPDEIKDFHLVTADSIIGQYNAGRAEWDRGQKIEGNVTITATKYLTTIDVEPDSSHHVFSFFLQVENNEANLLSVAPGRAEVIYLDRDLIVNSLVTKRILYFKMKSDKKPSYLEGLKDMKEYAGYGLGMRKVAKGYKIESAPFCSCISVDTKGWNCPSGGEGALSCGVGNDVGNCRINCSGQTFACCDSRTN